jgi:hypothetical protein
MNEINNKIRVKYAVIVFSIIILTVSNLLSQQIESTGLSGPYLGQQTPGNAPVEFTFDHLPSGYKLHSAPEFTPDGKEVYFSAMNFNIQFSEKIFVMKLVNNQWTLPQIASFSGSYFDGSPSISRDGKHLFFSSARNMNQDGMNENGERNIWYVERKGNDWNFPILLNDPIPIPGNGSDISELGNFYFNSQGDIYKIKFPLEGDENPEKLASTINSSSTELHPCIADDERFIVFYSSKPGHFGSRGGDLYISFKNNEGKWDPAINLGEKFNKGQLSTSFPRLSTDGKYFFFLKLVSIPWQCQVYWVSVDALEALNK